MYTVRWHYITSSLTRARLYWIHVVEFNNSNNNKEQHNGTAMQVGRTGKREQQWQ